MRTILKYVVSLAIGAFMLSSCAGTYTVNKMRTTSLTPDNVELKLTMEDFVFIKDADVSVTYNTYLGRIYVLREINGKEASKRVVNSVSTYGRTWMYVSPYLQRALYDAKQEIPDAEIFIPVTEVDEVQNMFLGSKVKKTLTVRAYKMKK